VPFTSVRILLSILQFSWEKFTSVFGFVTFTVCKLKREIGVLDTLGVFTFYDMVWIKGLKLVSGPETSGTIGFLHGFWVIKRGGCTLFFRQGKTFFEPKVLLLTFYGLQVRFLSSVIDVLWTLGPFLKFCYWRFMDSRSVFKVLLLTFYGL
jgi:hypothetical protein